VFGRSAGMFAFSIGTFAVSAENDRLRRLHRHPTRGVHSSSLGKRIRSGLLNSRGMQDFIVHIRSRGQRWAQIVAGLSQAARAPHRRRTLRRPPTVVASAVMDRGAIEVNDGFWNLRGSYRVAGILELGTHMSLVRRASGRYLALDACGLVPATRALLDDKTRGGEDLDAFLHLHPFHTLHVRALHQLYPRARLHGTARHHAQLADLPWEPLRTEDPALHADFAADLDFTVPRGVDLVTPNPQVHFGSVLAIHRATQTLHVDDTLMHARLPGPLRAFGRDVTRFHPALASALRRERGAAGAFRSWARELIERAGNLRNLCAAHTTTLLARSNDGLPIAARIEDALRRAEPTLRAHERKHEPPGTGSA
jgi:hypothetical protein